MGLDSLATPCGLYCGSCRYYLAEECMGCGTEDREGCNLYDCCRGEKKLNFCAECDDFPCPNLKKSVGLHPKWLDMQAKFQLKEKD